MRVFSLAVLIFVFSFLSNAQHEDSNYEDHAYHDHNGFEVGAGTGAFYMVHETEWAPGAHLHGMFNVNKVGFGLGFESAFAEIRHYGLGVIFSYRPIDKLEVSISPGILFDNEEIDGNQFAMHFEAIYSWEIDKLGHLGPVVGYGFAGHDKHLLLGLHLGIDL